ncbi:MAG: hypothetical protein D6766_10595 [Verrucomicrobia bacterium]|nr:MAG: hypothetical protein D6766_10595 [Verrucomicrobiota bacterium]
MPLAFKLALAGVAAYLVVIMAAMFVHGVWVGPFIARHRARLRGFVAAWMLGRGLIQDYYTARRICRERGIRPRWLSWFGWLLLVAGLLAVGVVGFILWCFWVEARG